MKCAYCGKAIKKAEQRDSAYQIGVGYMHPGCRDQYLGSKGDSLAREVCREA